MEAQKKSEVAPSSDSISNGSAKEVRSSPRFGQYRQ
jgi:hypothetical protein